jgi:hypothetical protein
MEPYKKELLPDILLYNGFTYMVREQNRRRIVEFL